MSDKGLLVMDIPENCEECKLCDFGDYTCIAFGIIGKNYTYEVPEYGVPDWCLLKVEQKVMNTMKSNLEYWKQQSIEKCSEAGELRIAIAERLEEIRTSIMITRQQLALEDNHFAQVILQWKIDQFRKQEEWLERTLSMKGARNAGKQV